MHYRFFSNAINYQLHVAYMKWRNRSIVMQKWMNCLAFINIVDYANIYNRTQYFDCVNNCIMVIKWVSSVSKMVDFQMFYLLLWKPAPTTTIISAYTIYNFQLVVSSLLRIIICFINMCTFYYIFHIHRIKPFQTARVKRVERINYVLSLVNSKLFVVQQCHCVLNPGHYFQNNNNQLV